MDFFLRSSPLIAAISNKTGQPPGVLPAGFVDGGVCLWGSPDPVCAGYQLHLASQCRNVCLAVPASHAVRTPHPSWMRGLRLWDPHPRATAPPKRAGVQISVCHRAAGGLR